LAWGGDAFGLVEKRSSSSPNKDLEGCFLGGGEGVLVVVVVVVVAGLDEEKGSSSPKREGEEEEVRPGGAVVVGGGMTGLLFGLIEKGSSPSSSSKRPPLLPPLLGLTLGGVVLNPGEGGRGGFDDSRGGVTSLSLPPNKDDFRLAGLLLLLPLPPLPLSSPKSSSSFPPPNSIL